MNKTNVKQVKTLVKKASTFVQVSRGFLNGFGIFLAALLLINGMWFVSRLYEQPDLFSRYFEPEKNLSAHPTAEYGSFFERAIAAYEAEKYQEAIQLGSTLLTQYPESDTLKYFLGASHLAQQQAKPAIYYLRDVAEDNDSPLQPQARWNLGLAYLLEGNRAMAKATLENSTHPLAGELSDHLSDP